MLNFLVDFTMSSMYMSIFFFYVKLTLNFVIYGLCFCCVFFLHKFLDKKKH
jgi:hypothetical protein